MAGERITALTPAPTTTVIAPTPIAAGIHTQPSFDVIELLPAASADRLRALRQRRDDARALTIPFEDIREASAARTNAENVVKRLLAPAGEGGFNLREGDSRVTRERQRLEKAQDEFDRLQARQAARAATFQAASQAPAACEDWLRHGKPSGVILQDFDLPSPKLNKGEAITDGILRLQRRCRELKSDLHRVKSAPHPSSGAKQRVRGMMEQLAARGAPDPTLLLEHGGDVVWPTLRVQSEVYGTERSLAFHEAVDVVGLLAFLLKPTLISALDALVDEASDDAAALSREARQEREAEVMADLLAQERLESALTWQAQTQGLPIEFRGDCNPLAILGCTLVTTSKPNAQEPSSWQHAYDIVRPGGW